MLSLNVLHKTMMQKPFHTYSSAGMVAGALSALCFGVEAHMNATLPTAHRPVWATIIFVLGPACCLMLPGVLIHPSPGRFFRLAVGTVFGSLFIVGARAGIMVNYGGCPPPPWPDFGTFGPYYLVSLCLTGFLATFYLSGQTGHLLAKAVSPLIGCVVLAALGAIFLKSFPPNMMMMEKWEALTLMIGGPCFGLVVWGALDIEPARKGMRRLNKAAIVS